MSRVIVLHRPPGARLTQDVLCDLLGRLSNWRSARWDAVQLVESGEGLSEVARAPGQSATQSNDRLVMEYYGKCMAIHVQRVVQDQYNITTER